MKKAINYLKAQTRQFYIACVMCCFSSLFNKNYTYWYKWQFYFLPYRESYSSDEGNIESLVVIPLKYKHDSGYRCMDFIAIRDNKAICRLSGCSDVIHFDGIGGYGKDWLNKYNKVPDTLPVKDWNIDSLLTSGLIRIFSHSYTLNAGAALSSFELYADTKRSLK